MKNIGVIGTRRRNTGEAWKKVQKKIFELYEEGDWIVSGGCKQGGDRFAKKFAKQEGVPLLTFYPAYKRYGNAAPIIRNGPVAFHSDIVIACVMDPEDGIEEVLKREKGGTEDTLRKFVSFKKSTTRIYLV